MIKRTMHLLSGQRRPVGAMVDRVEPYVRYAE